MTVVGKKTEIHKKTETAESYCFAKYVKSYHPL